MSPSIYWLGVQLSGQEVRATAEAIFVSSYRSPTGKCSEKYVHWRNSGIGHRDYIKEGGRIPCEEDIHYAWNSKEVSEGCLWWGGLALASQQSSPCPDYTLKKLTGRIVWIIQACRSAKQLKQNCFMCKCMAKERETQKRATLPCHHMGLVPVFDSLAMIYSGHCCSRTQSTSAVAARHRELSLCVPQCH